MKTHQKAAFIIGALILIVSFFPSGFALYMYGLGTVYGGPYPAAYIFPPIVGIVAAGIIVYLSFLFERDRK